VDVSTGRKRPFPLPGKYTGELAMSDDGRWMAARYRQDEGIDGTHVFIVDLAAMTRRPYSNGCSAAISPDGNWVTNNVDGHGRIVIRSRDLAKTIDIPTIGQMLPDNNWDNPQWSNHNDYIALKGDGRFGEAYVLKVSSRRFTRVTFGRGRVDYPDLYVRKEIQAGNAGAQAGPAGRLQSWPGDAGGLVFLWADAAGENVIPAADGSRACEAAMRDFARLDHDFAMDLAGGAFLARDADKALLDACRQSGELTLEAYLAPYALPGQSARIVTFSSGADQRNFTLAQIKDTLIFVLRTSATGLNGCPRIEICRLQAGRPVHMVVSFRQGVLTAWVNGKKAVERAVAGDLSNWTAQHLLFGDEWLGGHAWQGRLEGIAIYSQAVGPAAAAGKYELYMRRIKDRRPVERLTVQASLTRASSMPDPGTLDYPRCLAVYEYKVIRVIAGRYDSDRIFVAHWAMLGGQAVPGLADRKPGQSFTMTVEPYDDNTQLHSEKIVKDMDSGDLPVYFDVSHQTSGATAYQP